MLELVPGPRATAIRECLQRRAEEVAAHLGAADSGAVLSDALGWAFQLALATAVLEPLWVGGAYAEVAGAVVPGARSGHVAVSAADYQDVHRLVQRARALRAEPPRE